MAIIGFTIGLDCKTGAIYLVHFGRSLLML